MIRLLGYSGVFVAENFDPISVTRAQLVSNKVGTS